MATNVLRGARGLAVAATVVLPLALLTQLPADAAPGPGTWTSITTPADGTSFLNEFGHEGHLTVKGKTSPDVSAVNVYCLRGSGSSVDATIVATTVPVVTGGFTATVPVPSAPTFPQCRLRALPDGVSATQTYLASYAGPVVNFDSWKYLASQDTFQLRASSRTGTMATNGMGVCAAADLATVAPDETVPGGSHGCLYALGQSGLGATHGTVGVDGHEAFTTGAALGYGLTPTRLATSSFHLRHGGGMGWVETMPLDRCSTDTAFPPSAGTCPTLVSSGVEIRQVSTYLPGGHQVRIRTEFRSVDGERHALRLDYLNSVSPLADGVMGFRFPGQKSFHGSTTGEVVSALGHAAGTTLARSNRLSDEGDPAVGTRAITWSRTPSRITFSGSDPNTFEMSYRLRVPKGGSVHLGFADSDGVLTSQAVALGHRGERDMMSAPRISSPDPGSVIHGRTTTVKGVVTSGANGLPTSVTVNGHAATLKPNKSGSKAAFAATFDESLGKHTVTVVAKDAGGNTRSASVRIRNI